MYLNLFLYIIGDNDLSGTIPSVLGLLTNLDLIYLCKYGRRVDLCLEEHGWNPSSTFNFAVFPFFHDALILVDNQLSGPIPSELGLLTNLAGLHFCKCGRRVDLCLEEHGWNPSSTFNFAVFPFFHDALILDENQLTGSIPSELGLLTNLDLIYLCKYGRRVDLCLEEHGWNPSSTSNFAFFPLHDALILDDNQLTGSIPSELGLLTNLREIVLCKCGRRVDLCLEEHGWNPCSTSNFAFFPLHDALILVENQLTGSIPSELGLFTNLDLIYLCKCGRRVDLCLEEHGWNPSSTSNFAFFPLHDALILVDNQLTGSIPSELGLLTNLREIVLCKCGRRVDLCLEEHGWNPSSTFNFAFFPLVHDALILVENQMTGSIPSELGLLTNLRDIVLCKCGRRVDLCLEEHGWNPSSTFNFAFFPLVHDALILVENQMTGSIPSELGLLTNLRDIVLCKCGRRVDLCLEEHGWNPSSTFNFAFFPLVHDALILVENQMTGSIPSELFALPNIYIHVSKWIW